MAQRRKKIARYIEMGERNQTRIKEALENDGIEVSAATITRDIKTLNEDFVKSSRSSIEAEKGLSLRRLEKMLQELQAPMKRKEPWSFREARAIERDRAKLLGLDMPAKIAHTDPSGEKEYTGIPEDLKRKMLQEAEEEIIVDAEVIPELESAGESRDITSCTQVSGKACR